MADIDSFSNLEDPNRMNQQLDENSFSYLAEHPTVEGWKRRLYSLISGESTETLFRLGSVEQYVRVLLAESKDSVAEYCFRDALSQIVQEWNPSLLESADRLHCMFSLVAAFTPSVGFTKVLDYLNSTEDAKRYDERVSTRSNPVDLYKKGLVALAQYYPAPPPYSSNDFGFLRYKELLERNLTDERYSGYAAIRLIQLKVLEIKSDSFSRLFFSSDKAANEAFEYLIDLAHEPAQRQSAEEKLGDILVICAKADRLDKFKALASQHKARFDPEGDYQIFFPTLTLANGLVLQVSLDMEEVRETALSLYVRYSADRIRQLITPNRYEQEKLGRYVSDYITKLVDKPDSLNELLQELKESNARIDFSKKDIVIAVQGQKVPKNVTIRLDERVKNEFLKWYFKSRYYLETTEKFQFTTASNH